MEEEERSLQSTHSVHEEIPALHGEKKCLNCGAVLHGHYCSQCGQKDEDLHEPFWRLFADAFADFWHFDSKFFNTLFPLLFKPGFLTTEYIAGKRARYVHPIRLYFFVSVVFFVFYFSFSSQKFINDHPEILSHAGKDSVARQKLSEAEDTLAHILGNENVHLSITAPVLNFHDSVSSGISGYNRRLPPTITAYEDSLNKLPEDSMPGFFQQALDKKLIEANEKGGKEVFREIAETANHNLPKIMFVLLPIFAVLLKLLYIRRKVYFVDHAVFSLHFHALAFILFLLAFSLMAIFPNLHLGFGIVLSLIVYLFIALKKMHGQTIRKTLLKVFLLLFSYSLFIAVVMIFLIVYSALTF